MCLASPAVVVSIDSSWAVVRADGRDLRASTLLIPDIRPGEFVIVAAGTIVERLSPEEAAEIRDLLERAGASAADEPAASGGPAEDRVTGLEHSGTGGGVP